MPAPAPIPTSSLCHGSLNRSKSPCTVLVQACTCPTLTSWLFHGFLTRAEPPCTCPRLHLPLLRLPGSFMAPSLGDKPPYTVLVQDFTCPYSAPLAPPWLPQQVLNHPVPVQACTCHHDSSMAPSPGTRQPCTCLSLHLPLLRPPGSFMAPSTGAKPPCTGCLANVAPQKKFLSTRSH